MLAKEASSGQEKPRLTERITQISYLDQYRPTQKVKNFNEINFQDFKDNNGNPTNTLLLDFEGTCVVHNGWDVNPEIVEKIKSGNFENIAIITNKAPRDEKSLVQLNWWAKQIGADIVFTPTDRSERKPSPAMLLKALQHFGVTSDQALMIGDKLTADIAAANYAGVKSVNVDRLGKEDLEGDKYFRRPAEKVLFNRVKGRMGLKQLESKASQLLSTLATEKVQDSDSSVFVPEWVTDEAFPIWEKSVVDGFNNKPRVELSQEVKDAIPPGTMQVGVDKIRGILGEVDPKYKKQFDEFMYQHGRKIADGATVARIPGALIVAGLIITEHPKAAKWAHVVVSLTDMLDGWAARKSKEGPTKNGGSLDQKIDKFYTALIEAALVKKGKISKVHLARIIRDFGFNKLVRSHYEKQGVDTSAAFAGKVSTNAVIASDTFAMTDFGQNHPFINEVAQFAATGSKLYSATVYPARWIERHSHKKSGDESFERAKEALLVAA